MGEGGGRQVAAWLAFLTKIRAGKDAMGSQFGSAGSLFLDMDIETA